LQDIIRGRHVLPDERLVQDDLLKILERHEGTSRYINEFSANLKRNIGRGMKRIKYTVIPLIPEEIIQNSAKQLNDQ
jgi:hypothetical protein